MALFSSAVPLASSDGITITKADGTSKQHFRQARDVPTNASMHGPQVDHIVNNIVNMSPELRAELQAKLANAGL